MRGKQLIQRFSLTVPSVSRRISMANMDEDELDDYKPMIENVLQPTIQRRKSDVYSFAKEEPLQYFSGKKASHVSIYLLRDHLSHRPAATNRVNRRRSVGHMISPKEESE